MPKAPQKTPTVAKALANQRAENELVVEQIRAKRLAVVKDGVDKMAALGGTPGRSDRYESASRTRLRSGPKPSGGSADRHLTPTVQGSLRRDCQDLDRNSTSGQIVIRRAQQLIVGDGPIVTSHAAAGAKAKKWNKEADRLWNLYFDAIDPEMVGYVDIRRQLSGPEILAGIVGSWCTDGDQLIVRNKSGSLVVVEGERVCNPNGLAGSMGTPTPNGTTIFGGVETDRMGVPVRYHVADWDMNGSLAYANTKPVEAVNARLILNPMGLKPGQTRGEPALQSVLDRIARLDHYELSVAVAAEMATKFAAIVRSDNPGEIREGWEASTPDQPDRDSIDQPKETEIQPGMIHFMDRGGDIIGLDPKFPGANFKEYVAWHLSMIGAVLGIPLVATVYDASQLSWSNIKALLSLSMRSIEPSQARLARLVRWIRAWKMREWMNDGLLPWRDDYMDCEVVFPRAPVVDFKSEVEGYKLAIDARLMTRDQATQALGSGTFESVAAKQSEEEKLLTSLGIPQVNAPGTGGGPGAKEETAPEAEPAGVDE